MHSSPPGKIPLFGQASLIKLKLVTCCRVHETILSNMSVMMQAQSLCFCTVLCICFLMEIIWLSSSECFGYVLGSWTSMISFAGSGRTEKLFGDLMLVLLFDAFDLNLVDVSLGKA